MTPALASDLFRSMLMLALKVAGPLLATMTAAAVLFGIIQAATQVQDSTVSFTPKLAGALMVAWFGASWMTSMLTDFMHKALKAIPWMVAR
jgi:flagellar biosynthetic protein FliQ